ncbi:NAD(+) diphosphatase [Actinomycetospora lemnae]|uniref:NAD(+) diphosphatase n=1 Tax=Actinomycetospora lemnae TaxID=3019891 RepID=A0ABT5SQW1_9PSEU|nr:NAD(+) diphosphatase [Actinomycetospora sp. DW7H6]MDD7965179.1 NAD(+) diphosphatase [Actinomycetospora sp. DW7H6]
MTGTAGPDLRAAFHLDADPSLSRSTVDRREQLRVDPEHVKRLWPDAQVVLVDPHGRTPVERGDDGTLTLAFAPTTGVGDDIPEGAVLLGEEGGTAYWAVRVPDPAEAESNDAGSGFMTAEQWERAGGGPDHENWTDLRSSGADLDARSAGLLTTAVALLNWHDRSRFCARDGSEMDAIKSGWAQLCRAHGHEEYPRTDPSMICLVHDGADRVLLARQPIWPAGRYSVLAGFVEAGESLEACVARECAEEVGVEVHTISYLGSQPWPFPRSLMIGFTAVADPEQTLRLQEGEIEGARWVTRAELQRALDAGAWSHRDGGVGGRSRSAGGVGGTAFEAGSGRELILPGGVSIARAMLEAWAAAG